MQIKKQFIKFLKDEGVFWMYRENWKNDRPKTRHIRRPKGYVSGAFLFETSHLPHKNKLKFWEDINNKWLSHLESIGYKK